MKLYLEFNQTFEEVKVKLEGGGTLFIDSMKKEHYEVLALELVNLILDHSPEKMEFISHANLFLLDLLKDNNVFYNEKTQKLLYKR